MTKIYSYVLRFDDGAAPNPFWGKCTLTICKPAIRRKAQPGSWVIGTGSKHSKCNDGNTYNFNGMLIYAMKIKEVMTLEKYDEYCRKKLQGKIPDKNNADYRFHLGDAIYDYSQGSDPLLRDGQHTKNERDRDLSGTNALISDNYYYFGENPILLPQNLQCLVKKNQGHKIIDDPALVTEFENWISSVAKNGIHGKPQLLFRTIVNIQNLNSINCGTNSCSPGAPTQTAHLNASNR